MRSAYLKSVPCKFRERLQEQEEIKMLMNGGKKLNWNEIIRLAIKADQEHMDKLRITETNAWRVEAKCLDLQRGDSMQVQMMLDNSCKTETKQMLRRVQSCCLWCKRKGHVVANWRCRLEKCHLL